MNIRFAEPVDLTTIMAFDAFPGDRIVEIIERRMLVIQIDGQVRAYTSWQKNGCIGKDYINKLVVDHKLRRRGLAKRLISALDTALHGRVFISAPAGNPAAMSLLESMQWTKGGEIKGLLPLGEAEVFFYKDL